KALEQSDKKWDEERLPKLLKEQAQMFTSQITESEKRTDAKIETLKREVMTEIAAIKRSASPSSTSGSAPGSSSTSRSKQNFVAKHVEIKGFAEFSEDGVPNDETCATEQECQDLPNTIATHLESNITDTIDVKASNEKNARNELNTNIYIILKTPTLDPEAAWNLRNAVTNVISQHSLKVRGSTPQVTVEAAPDRKPYRRAGGRFMGVMNSNGKSTDSYKIEWQGVPLKVYMKNFHGSHRSRLLASFRDGSGWTIVPEVLSEFPPKMSKDDLSAKQLVKGISTIPVVSWNVGKMAAGKVEDVLEEAPYKVSVLLFQE
ncbi:unnamed protein product, partial [Prorocentrum cordatum]